MLLILLVEVFKKQNITLKINRLQYHWYLPRNNADIKNKPKPRPKQQQNVHGMFSVNDYKMF